ncbi:hypothetical protein RRG08_045829 [Elysia crispata]|uniref:Uncharacterized protein n=1 Tax=Elysia crispata TaxID=231223 RepID=A0AAE1E9I4_9GAST|nr:hypothetical protein RRG08_045829 [Elysia crispata]
MTVLCFHFQSSLGELSADVCLTRPANLCHSQWSTGVDQGGPGFTKLMQDAAGWTERRHHRLCSMYQMFMTRLQSCYPRHVAGYPRQVAGYPRQVAGYPRQVAGYPRHVADYPRQVAGYPRQVAGYPRHVAGYPRQVAGYPRHVAGYPRQVAGYPRQVAGYPRQVAGYPRQVAGYPRQLGLICLEYNPIDPNSFPTRPKYSHRYNEWPWVLNHLLRFLQESALSCLPYPNLLFLYSESTGLYWPTNQSRPDHLNHEQWDQREARPRLAEQTQSVVLSNIFIYLRPQPKFSYL